MSTSLTGPKLYINGRLLDQFLLWGDLKVTHRWSYGCWAMEWGVALKPYERPPALKVGALIEARVGPRPVWSGQLADFDWDAQEMTAVGAARQGEETLCLTAAGETSSTPDAVIDQGIARGSLRWTRLASLSGSPLSTTDQTSDLNYVTALLDAWGATVKKRWGVDALRRVYAAADPTTPSIYVRPGAGVLGVTGRTQASSVFCRYKTTTGGLATVKVGAGAPEVGVYAGSYGRIDAARATAIATTFRDQLQATTAWTNGVTVTADQVTTPGGQDLSLDRVTAGQMARLLGLRDVRGAAASTDVVMGETIWDVTAGTVQLNPVGLEDRSLSGVAEDAGLTLL